ncbi:hypothetical protein K435DRAFT_611241, partial [Dendrothele bispora CBS 962.96]
ETDGSGSSSFSASQVPTKFVNLTMPQLSPNMPPRPEFTPFQVPNFCESNPYDDKDFWTYPERCGWIVHAEDARCHVLCPPRLCLHGMSEEEILEESRLNRDVRDPMFSRLDNKPVLASDKVAFLQAWLFFGLLTVVSDLCGLEIDVAAEFIIDNGMISTAKLNGLPLRWFEAAVKTQRAGDKTLMENILNLARHSFLMLSEELVSESTPKFVYSYAQCRTLQSLEILVRIIGLHLLLHTRMPGFTTTENEGWGRDRISGSLRFAIRYTEGMDQLSGLAIAELRKQG